MKFEVIVADPPWSFSDRLEMSDVKRGAAANYKLMSNQDIVNLKVAEVAADNAVLLLWVPSSLLSLGLEVMENWGFKQTQTLPWVKVKQDPFEKLKKLILSEVRKPTFKAADLDKCFAQFDLNALLSFGMGRLFRQCHELVVIGVRGKVYDQLKNKSQRSIVFGANFKHSKKPEELQDRLEIMFPDANRLEMFARREKLKWTCVGLECPSSQGEDMVDSLARLAKL